MIPSNENPGKPASKKRYFLSVLRPAIFTLFIICGLTYFASYKNYLLKKDVAYGYMFSFVAAAIAFAITDKNWLKMPDRTYRNIKNYRQTSKVQLTEPAEYEAEFFASKKSGIVTLLAGLFFIGFCILYSIKEKNSVLIPIGSFTLGSLLVYVSIKSLFS